MTSESVQAFNAKVAASPELQDQLRSIPSPIAFVALAQREGIELTPEDFKEMVEAAYRQWVERLPEKLRLFFEQVQNTESLNQQMKQCQTPAAAIELAKSVGVDLTEAELQAAADIAETIVGFSFEKMWFRNLGLLPG